MYRKWAFKYSIAAAIIAIAIIAVSLFANQMVLPSVEAKSNFAVLLTDPPTVPAGTTQLNMTYSGLLLHVVYSNGSTEWIPLSASGTVNLFSLVNMTQTIASTTIPTNTTVDKVQFSISEVSAEINGQTYNVTTLSDTFVVKVSNGAVNQTLSGVLIDFNPTLVQIQASDENDTTVYYYVLVPSANAMVINGIDTDHLRIGTLIKIGENNRVCLERIKEDFSRNVTIVSATLTVKDDSTSLSVALENRGNFSFRIFGLTLHGEFNVVRGSNGKNGMMKENDHPSTIPFKLSGTSLIPLPGNGHDHDDYHGFSSVVIQPGESLTLAFSGVIAVNTGRHDHGFVSSLTPLVDDNYTLRLMGEGFQTFTVKAAVQP
jgi:hypothetical protein